MLIPKVSSICSPRTGKPVANQFLIETDDLEVFQSYNSIIGTKDAQGQITLDKSTWDYSVTTSKYRNQWLGLNTSDTKKRILDGRIKLGTLN